MKTTFLMMLMAFVQHQGQQHHDPQHSFEDTHRWIEEFENPERDAQQKPDEVVRALNLSPGDVVADIGAGTGYFTRRFAKAVGDNGIAYAVDLEPNMLKYVGERAEKDGQPNIVPVFRPVVLGVRDDVRGMAPMWDATLSLHRAWLDR